MAENGRNNAERPSFDPINTWERSQKEAVYSVRKEEDENENLTSHREVEAVYHYLDSGKKREMIEAAAAAAFEELGIDSVTQTERFPEEWENFSDIPAEEDGAPQVFSKPIGDGEVLIVMRANNGNPNTVVMFSTHPEADGRIDLDLSGKKGLMHVCTEQDLDDARNWPYAKLARSLEGKWMRGDISSEEYKTRFAEKQGKKLTDFHKDFDKIRREDRDTQFKTYLANRNLQGDTTESMWTEEDEGWQIRQERIRRRVEIARGVLNDMARDVRRLRTFGANIAEDIKIGWAKFKEGREEQE